VPERRASPVGGHDGANVFEMSGNAKRCPLDLMVSTLIMHSRRRQDCLHGQNCSDRNQHWPEGVTDRPMRV